MENTTAMLKAKQLKVTPQRLAIYNVLLNTKEHPSAETIYNALQETYPTMSLATVYKTLDVLKKAGLVIDINVGEDSFRYDADISNHAHMICTACGSVTDFHSPLIGSFQDSVNEASDFKVEGQKLFFYGLCPDCQQAAN